MNAKLSNIHSYSADAISLFVFTDSFQKMSLLNPNNNLLGINTRAGKNLGFKEFFKVFGF